MSRLSAHSLFKFAFVSVCHYRIGLTLIWHNHQSSDRLWTLVFFFSSVVSVQSWLTMTTTYTRTTTTRKSTHSYDSGSVSPMPPDHLLPPKVELLRTPSPKDKIEDDKDIKYHSHHLDYKYTPPPVKGPCVACGMYIVGSVGHHWWPEVTSDVILASLASLVH